MASSKSALLSQYHHLLLQQQLVIFMITTVLLSLAHPSLSLTYSSHGDDHVITSRSSITTFKGNYNNNIGFTLPLIDSINSPQSPFYNPNLTRLDRIQLSIRISHLRHQYIVKSKSLISSRNNQSSPDWIETPVGQPYPIGTYLTSFKIGTPPIDTLSIVDTGSSLIWLQCLPCESCYKQKPPIFDPRSSSSYNKISCNDYKCHSWLRTTWCSGEKSCRYYYAYADGTSTEGNLATETLTFGYDRAPGTISLPNMIVGCGDTNNVGKGGVTREMPPGILGLNRGTLSFSSQLGMDHFSYCLLPVGPTTSKMHFGLAALIVGGKTPLIKNDRKPDHYYINLEGISVGNKRLQLPAGTFELTQYGTGGLIIDSGSTLTYLNSEGYDALIEEIKNTTSIAIGEDPVKNRFHLCYWAHFEELEKSAPNVTFHFTGVDLELNKENTWIQVQKVLWNQLWCLAILRSANDDLPSLLGSYQQRNVNVGYDTKQDVISFKPMDCTKT